MKYSDLNLVFDLPPTPWFFDTSFMQNGLSFQDAWRLNEEFKIKRDMVKDGIIQSISPAIDNANCEREIGEVLYPIFERLSKSFFFSEDINQALLLKKANRNTLAKKLQSWCDQLNQNIPIVRKSPGVHVFKNKLKNVPCVIVCAGPSLANNIELLSAVKGKAMVMAVDTSLRSLIKRGIEPDFVNAHDANPQGAKFFDGIKTDCIGLFVNYVSPQSIAAFNGLKSFYYVQDDSIATYKTMALACDSPDRKDGSFMDSNIIGGSSVAHTAMYLALSMGCNPITFLGLDLSYPNPNKTHFESDNMKSVSNQKLVDVIDLRGKKVKTNLSFFSYKTVFENMLPAMKIMYGTDIFTSTEDENGAITGIVHVGMIPKPFKEFLDQYCKEERQELSKIKEIYKSYGKHTKK